MTCNRCQSEACNTFPADVRVYMNNSRTVSAPPMTPGPMIAVCLSCGWSEFHAPEGWLAAGWLRPIPVPEYKQFNETARG